MAIEPKELVGYYAALPYIYQIDGQPIACGMVCDVMTHPDRRGKGIFTKIDHYSTSEMKKNNLAFTTGYPIRPEVIPGHIKVGWKIVQEMPIYLRLVGTKTLLPKAVQFLAPLLNIFVILAQSWTLISFSKYQVETLLKEDFFRNYKNLYQDFLKTWLAEQDNALIKSLPFSEWKTGAPESIYRFLVSMKGQQMVGVSIVRLTVLRSVDSLAILDFMILREHFPAAKTIHQALWRTAREFKKDVIVCMTSSQWAINYKFLGSLYVKTLAIFSFIV